MQRYFRYGLLLAMLCLGAWQLAAHAQDVQIFGRDEVATDELLVKVAPNLPDVDVTALTEKLGGREHRRFRQVNWVRIKLPPGQTIAEAVGRAKGIPGVMSAEPNYIYHTTATPNDPRMSQLWGLTKIQAPTAWDSTTGSSNVVVAVLDTGVNYNHEDLLANAWRNPGEVAGNRVDDDRNGYVDDVYGINAITRTGDPMDDAGHGTHVAGTIGAVGNNGVGVSGVNWNVKILSLKFMGANGSGRLSDAIACYDYAIALKRSGVNIRVINNSWGGSGYSQSLKDAIDTAGNAGIISVAAAGNGNSSGVGQNNDAAPSYPASYQSASIIAVAASDQSDRPASFSNYGATSVDLAAPGVSIYSTYRTSNSAYATMSGTSMATPHVAGAVALVLAKNPSLTVASAKSALLDSVDKLSLWTGKVVSGGRLNLARAIQNAGGGTPSPTYTYQPDLLIRANAASSFLGDNVYSVTNQSVTQQTTTGVAAVYQAQIQNDGTTADSFTVTGPASSGGWTIRFFNAVAGGTDITASVTGTGWRTSTLAPGATAPFRIEMTPASTVTAGVPREELVTARSQADSAKTDAVKAVATVSAPTGKLTSVTLSASPLSPQPVNTTITLTAAAQGGPAEYRYFVQKYLPTGWSVIASSTYTTSPSAIWRPSSDGKYFLIVYARTPGSTARYDVLATLSYTITASPTATSVDAKGKPSRASGPELIHPAAPGQLRRP